MLLLINTLHASSTGREPSLLSLSVDGFPARACVWEPAAAAAAAGTYMVITCWSLMSVDALTMVQSLGVVVIPSLCAILFSDCVYICIYKKVKKKQVSMEILFSLTSWSHIGWPITLLV